MLPNINQTSGFACELTVCSAVRSWDIVEFLMYAVLHQRFMGQAVDAQSFSENHAFIAQLPLDFHEIRERPGQIPTWWRKLRFFFSPIFWIIKGTEMGPSQWWRRPGSLFPGLLKILGSHGRAVGQLFFTCSVFYFLSVISFQQKHLSMKEKRTSMTE